MSLSARKIIEYMLKKQLKKKKRGFTYYFYPYNRVTMCCNEEEMRMQVVYIYVCVRFLSISHPLRLPLIMQGCNYLFLHLAKNETIVRHIFYLTPLNKNALFSHRLQLQNNYLSSAYNEI